MLRGLIAACVLANLSVSAAFAQTLETVRVGVLKFGTVSWEMDVIKRNGLDKANGVDLQVVELASNDATKIALNGNTVDIMTTDWLFVSRQRAENFPIVLVPFSTTIGAVMVVANSPIRSMADLKGKKIGVSGGPIDKSWLMLLAATRKDHGLDLAKEAEAVYGAPPLLTEKLARGELDAAVLFWNFAAKLEAQGFRRLMALEDVEKSLGAEAPVSMIGFTFLEKFAKERPKAIEGFLAASAAARKIMRESDAEWEKLKPQVRAESDEIFAMLKKRYREGIPTRPIADDERDAARLYAVIAGVGGEKLVGRATTLVEGTFYKSRPGS